ncbi:UvrD-helicase domain-containing protein [Alcanivorax sp. DP30]|uniref:UvrD-helicase domain-containing protein n=1 Tax=Alcanivorax sp. DP30 TaxID=2606217 RepID=UPI0013707159|nr:UvrD-helicase domain-containing protein [Alcanivorax sp. DP30]MZR63525.1 AAA family ATPase [Alcanivorax sp. DP30]
MSDARTVLASHRGLVEAPAGCGKTQLIVEVLDQASELQTLVLTHTSAGVAALRNRLLARGVPKNRYKVATIDSWVIHTIGCYPQCAEYVLDPNHIDYLLTRQAAIRLCNNETVGSIIKANYGRLLVDEYQDCSISQHALISALSNILPTVVFGDPLQAIFGFGGDALPHWGNEVLAFYPHLGTMGTPWRWNNSGAGELGAWLLQVRQSLIAGQSIDLRTCPNFIEWLPIPANPAEFIQAQINIQISISNQFPGDNILIIGDSINPDTRHSYASRARGVQVVETVDLRDTLDHVRNINNKIGAPLLEAILGFLRNVMVNVDGNRMLTRIQSIMNGRNRTPPTPQENAAVGLCQNGGYSEALMFIESMSQDTNRRVYRGTPFRLLVEALKRVSSDPSMDLVDVFISMREQRRHAGRMVKGKSVGSTLLLKGLEADHVIILDADHPDPRRKMDAKHLYVALTRGAKSVKIFSRSPILP